MSEPKQKRVPLAPSAVLTLAALLWGSTAQAAGLSPDVEVYCDANLQRSDCGTFNTWRSCTTKIEGGFAFDLSCLNHVMKDITRARPEPGTKARGGCIGTVHLENGDLGLFTKGEEGICIIDSHFAEKVLKVCSIGQKCAINGSTYLCLNQAECAYASDITSIKRY